MNVAEFERYLAMVAQLLPAPDHTFDAPRVPDQPTDADVMAATARLIELEQLASEMPDRLRYIEHISQSLSYVFNEGEATAEQSQRFWDAMLALNAVRESYVEHQQLLAQQIGHWNAAVAVMEHDIAWQQSSGQQVRHRPIPSRALIRAASLAVA